MRSTPQKSTIVVGAGVIGTAIAYDLQKRGRSVTLIDSAVPGSGASFGNMASIAVTEFMPIARPAVWRQIPKWVLDPAGPIRLSPMYMPKLMPWFLRFLGASRPSAVRRIERAGAALCKRALGDTQALMAEIGIAHELSKTGCISLYASEAEFKADQDRVGMLDRFRFEYSVLEGDAIRDLEPEITPDMQKAVLLPNNRTIADPQNYVSQLVTAFSSIGGEVYRDIVVGFEVSDRVRGVSLARGQTLLADEVVLCAGAQTGRLSKMLGEPIPLETERGYHTHIMAPNIGLRHSFIWPARAFMVSPTAGGIRVGGTVEMAGLDAAPNYQRAELTAKRARIALPNLQLKETTQWMGHRPALPDTVPILSASAKVKGLFYATGHGHLGVTQAATSALLMGELIVDGNTDFDITPYRVDRF